MELFDIRLSGDDQQTTSDLQAGRLAGQTIRGSRGEEQASAQNGAQTSSVRLGPSICCGVPPWVRLVDGRVNRVEAKFRLR